MQRHHKKVIDSVSSSDLLQALTTLKALGKPQGQFQISFSKENVIKLEDFPDFPKNDRTIDYEHYMAGKQQNRTFNNQAVTPIKSPLLQHKNNHPPKVSNFKSRSHSPLDRKSQRTESRISQLSRQTLKKTYQNREVRKKEELKKKEIVVCPSSQSKKIIEQKQKSGRSYVPIQYRAEELLREKQQKIARLQKQKKMTKILQEKECTFKPQIKPYYKKQQQERDEQQHKVSEYQRQRFEECFIDQEFICAQPPSNQNQTNLKESFLGNYPERRDEKQGKCIPRRYKNEKFNYLLDLIQ